MMAGWVSAGWTSSTSNPNPFPGKANYTQAKALIYSNYYNFKSYNSSILAGIQLTFLSMNAINYSFKFMTLCDTLYAPNFYVGYYIVFFNPTMLEKK